MEHFFNNPNNPASNTSNNYLMNNNNNNHYRSQISHNKQESGDSLLNNLLATKNVYSESSSLGLKDNNNVVLVNNDNKNRKVDENDDVSDESSSVGIKRTFFEHCATSNSTGNYNINNDPLIFMKKSQQSILTKQIKNSTTNMFPRNMNSDQLVSGEMEPDHMWYIMFETLLQFCIQNNHCNVPYGFEIFLNDGVILKLGQWLHQQRERKQQGLLAEDQLIVLQSLVDSGKLLWEYQISETESDKYDSLWSLYFDALVAFSDEFGNCNVPKLREYKLPDGTIVKLGLWLENQRRGKRNGTLPPMRASRLQYLVDIGKLNWFPITELNRKSILDSGDRWMMFFDALLRYCDQYGTCNVPYKTDYKLLNGEVIRLGRWIDKQRQKQRKGELNIDRENLLQFLVDGGKLKWRLVGVLPCDDQEWQMMYEALLQYSNSNGGDCNVRMNYQVELSDGNSLKLGQWLSTQRVNKKKGTLTEKQEALLQDLVDAGRLLWDASKIVVGKADNDKWQLYFDTLVQYGRENGNCNIPQAGTYPLADGTVFKLGMWLNKQRKDKKNACLPKDRENKLQSLVDSGYLKWNMFHPPKDSKDS